MDAKIYISNIYSWKCPDEKYKSIEGRGDMLIIFAIC